jgi:Ca2+/H+ antiporter
MGRIFDRRSSSPRPDAEVGDTTSNGHGSQHSKEEDDEEEEEPQLSMWGAFLLLTGVTVITGVTAEFLVGFSRSDLRIRA